MSIPDKQILSLFQLFESHRTLSTASLLKSWSASGVIGVQRALDAMMSLAAGKVFATCIAFSMRRALLSDGPTDGAGEGFYDPAFILPLFVAVLDEHLTGLDWVQVLRSNLLGLAICSLASRDAAMRALGRRVLAKTTGLISVSPPAPTMIIELTDREDDTFPRTGSARLYPPTTATCNYNALDPASNPHDPLPRPHPPGSGVAFSLSVPLSEQVSVPAADFGSV